MKNLYAKLIAKFDNFCYSYDKGGMPMESIDRLNQAISYIEEHLTDIIDYEQISKITLSPISSFQHFFYLTTGFSLSEYIKRRRLACAASDLINTNKHITDIAVKYGYKSPNTFSVAFKRHYHISPVDVKKANLSLPPFPRMYYKLTVEQVTDGARLKKMQELTANSKEVEIFEQPQVLLVGREIRTLGNLSFLAEPSTHKQLYPGLEGNRAPELWDLCRRDGSLQVIQQLPSLSPDAIIGWTGDYSQGNDHTASYVIGAFVQLGTPVPTGYACRVLPATLVAKGVYATPYPDVIKTYESWGYEHNSDLYDWWGEIYFKQDPSPTNWSTLVPIKKVWK